MVLASSWRDLGFDLIDNASLHQAVRDARHRGVARRSDLFIKLIDLVISGVGLA
jgi:hypothetical protein